MTHSNRKVGSSRPAGSRWDAALGAWYVPGGKTSGGPSDHTGATVICIDGPTASGKGTLSAILANELGFHLLDSGALYRLTALAAMQRGLPVEVAHERALASMIKTLTIEFVSGRALLDGLDVSDAIRGEDVGMSASTVSSFPAVRHALVDLQHSFHRAPGLIADGRDMGTVIFPGSPLKIFLTASAEKRAHRRYEQLIAKGLPASVEFLRDALAARDAQDSSRSVAPLKPADDAILLDNSEMSIKQSVDLVLGYWQERQVSLAPRREREGG